LLARDSESVTELIANTKDEGHPILWNFLFFCSRDSRPILSRCNCCTF
jgi:hypothetical protein